MRSVKARRIVEERERLLLTDQFELKLLGQKMRILKEERDLWKVKTVEEVKESLIISMDEEVADAAGISQLDTPGRGWMKDAVVDIMRGNKRSRALSPVSKVFNKIEMEIKEELDHVQFHLGEFQENMY